MRGPCGPVRFSTAFLQMLLWRPHRAIGALYWHVTKRRVRARNRLRLASAQAPHAYRMWIDEIERQDEAVVEATDTIAGWKQTPSFTIAIPLLHEADGSLLRMSIAALAGQCLGAWRAIVVCGHDVDAPTGLADPRVQVCARTAGDAAEALAIAIGEASGDYVVPLMPGALLPPTALFRYAEAVRAEDRPAIVFGDHDEIDRLGRRSQPWFKPEWNVEMFLGQDYISPACAIRSDRARAAGAVAADVADVAVYAMLLQVGTEDGARVVRVPYIQCHARHSADDTQAARVRAVTHHLRGSGASVSAGPFQSVRVQWPLPAVLPLVSVIVPTRDQVRLLRACVSGVLGATRYHDVEVVIVDNGSTDAATLRYLAVVALDPRVRVLAYDHPYNYSAINNFAAAQARGEYLCLLNNDTEILDAEWLTELMRYAVKPQVGAVGAKLLYDDGSIQHAGVVVGLGEAAGHAHRYLKPDDPGYFRQAHIPHYVSAVTAACLVVEKRKFLAVGGLDEEGLRIAFNDVDLCLKLARAGWRNVYAPQAVLVHHESKSRGRDHSPAHIDRYMNELGVLQNRWGTKTHADPLHHPNLDRSSETFVIHL